MITIIAPIVGMYYRLKEDGIPAQAILNNLPNGTPLSLEAEPDNEYDVNAVKINLLQSNVPHNEEIEVDCAAQGWNTNDLYGTGIIHLGYIDSKKTGAAAKLAPILDLVISCVLTFSAEGKPGVKVELNEVETPE